MLQLAALAAFPGMALHGPDPRRAQSYQPITRALHGRAFPASGPEQLWPAWQEIARGKIGQPFASSTARTVPATSRRRGRARAGRRYTILLCGPATRSALRTIRTCPITSCGHMVPVAGITREALCWWQSRVPGKDGTRISRAAKANPRASQDRIDATAARAHVTPSVQQLTGLNLDVVHYAGGVPR